jgi:hypothetical protein
VRFEKSKCQFHSCDLLLRPSQHFVRIYITKMHVDYCSSATASHKSNIAGSYNYFAVAVLCILTVDCVIF